MLVLTVMVNCFSILVVDLKDKMTEVGWIKIKRFGLRKQLRVGVVLSRRLLSSIKEILGGFSD
ncbi:hypothetical protein D3C78_1682730 [compost metagenome]